MNTDINSSLDDSSKMSFNTSEKSSESTPMRITTPLELKPNSDKADIARKQLENLSRKPRKRQSPTAIDNENSSSTINETRKTEAIEQVSEVLYSGKPTMSNLSSAIISREELENEIRKKIVKSDPELTTTVKKISAGEIEIPQELILSELTAAPVSSKVKEEEIASQLDGQELIDILEGKPDEEEGEMFEVFNENGMLIVKSDKKTDQSQTTSYEIIATEDEKMAETKQKLLEREIAMRQIASMPTRKNRKLKQTQGETSSSKQQQQSTTLVQSLAMDWSDKEEEVILELENVVEENNSEPKIKILNMTILNEASEEIKSRSSPKLLPIVKVEPKILNKNAPKINPLPKILNINAPQTSSVASDDVTPKRGRVIKKKTIWDPSEISSSLNTNNTTVTLSPQTKAKLPIALPSTITIKKLTKESIIQPTSQSTAVKNTPTNEPPTAKRSKKKSEVDKLFQDEGAVNMIYSLERQNNNQDVPELKVSVDQKSLIDKSEEKFTLMAKTKTIKQTIIKQSTSPTEANITPARPQRMKRDLTPCKAENEPEKKSVFEKADKGVVIAKVQKSAQVGRRKKTDDTWDYVRHAQATCDDAMIIRRHSNSSYSSSAATSPRRLSLDQSLSDVESGKLNDSQKNSFKFTKPHEKKTQELQKNLKECVGGLVEELRNTLSSKLAKGKVVQNEKITKAKKRTAAVPISNVNQESPPTKRLSERRSYGSEKDHFITKVDGVAYVTISSNPLTINSLSEMKTMLSQLEKDDACKLVYITPSESFSKGLDYSTLIQTTVDKRKQAASDLVTAVKSFLISLAAFPKILVAGLRGSITGIAVTMLPLFDLVIADSSAKFSLPHGHIGSNPEGISLLQTSNKINSKAITELFYLNEIMNAGSAFNYGLVTKIIPKNMEDEAKSICKTIVTLSTQALESTKSLLTDEFLSSLDQQLSKEMKILQHQWISAECQEKFKKQDW